MKLPSLKRTIFNAFRLLTRRVVLRIIRFTTKLVELLHSLIVSLLMVMVQWQHLVVTIPTASLEGMLIKIHMVKAVVLTTSVQEPRTLNVIHPHALFHLNPAKTELKEFAKS